MLIKANQHYKDKENSIRYEIDPANHVINRKDGTVKNLLRLTNKTMIGINNTKVNKLAICMSLAGLGLGYVLAEIDDGITYFKQNYRKVIR